jgi:hypothetical protein
MPPLLYACLVADKMQCSEQKNFVNSQICSNCGGAGHIASDCKVPKSEVRIRERTEYNSSSRLY